MNTKTQKPLNLSHFFIFSSDYFIVSIIPTILFLLLQGIYFFTSQKCIPGLLSLRSLPFIILASGTFFILFNTLVQFHYLKKHSHIFFRSHIVSALTHFCKKLPLNLFFCMLYFLLFFTALNL